VFQINLALTDLQSGTVVAQASSRARDEGLDMNPTALLPRQPDRGEGQGGRRLHRDVPGGARGARRTRSTSSASPTASTIAEATVAYNNESYQDALALYQSAAAKPGGEQLRVLNGVYLASWKLRRYQRSRGSVREGWSRSG
jgi:hypothetical protein